MSDSQISEGMLSNIPDLEHRTCIQNELRMVMIGKTGVGKSETGNTIAGEDIFEADAALTSVTTKCKQYTFQRNGQNLQLIDVPGFIDTKRSTKDIKTEVMRCVGLSHPGIHAILFVIQIGRFAEDDVKTLEEFCSCFGQDSMGYVIVIVTKIDSLKRKKKTLKQVLDEAQPALTSFLAKVNHRYIGVNNWSEDESERESFFNNLLSMVRSLVEANGGKCYTNEMYKNATEILEEEAEKKMKRLAEEERKRDEEKLRKTREEYEQKQRQKEVEMKKEMEVRQKEIERAADEKRKQEEEKRIRMEEELRKSVEQQKLQQEEKERQMKAFQMEIEKQAEEERARVEEEKRKAKEEFERKQKEELERMEREMKEKEERLRKEIEEERRARVIEMQRKEVEESRGLFGRLADAVGGFLTWVFE